MASVMLSSILHIVGKLRSSNPSSSSSPLTAVELQGDMRHLERTLRRIQAVLADAEDREIRDQSVKLWLQELRALAVQAEDVLDEFHYELLHQQASQKLYPRKSDTVLDSLPLSAHSLDLESIGKQIHAIRQMFEEIERDKEALRLQECDCERRIDLSWKPVPTSSFHGGSRIYGREQDKEKIVEFLLDDNLGDKEIVKSLRGGGPDVRSISVLPIVGMGGLGKTTLAQVAYNNESVQEYFHVRVWICVSDNFDVVRITKQIIESCTDQRCDKIELDELQKSLAKLLTKKKLLVVLDDVNNERPSLWEILKTPFAHADLTKVLVTTRSELVASIMQTRSLHILSHLNEEDCLRIFGQFVTRQIYQQEREAFQYVQYNKFETIARQIVKKCKGLPLVAKTLGSLLHNEIDEDRWNEIAESELWNLEDQRNDILPILRLSYHRMPSYLKQCFAYFGSFPKSYVFQKEYMVKLWIAQGYIVPKGKRSLEDVASVYFDELVQRSMLQPSQFCKTKNEGYIMHDLIHDLAIFITENQCLSVMDHETTSISTNLLHASFVPSRDQVTLDFHVLGSARHLRTLIVPMSRHMQSSIYNLPDSETREVQFNKHDFLSWYSSVPSQLNNIEYALPGIMIQDHVVDQKQTAMLEEFQCYNSSGYEISESMIQMFQQLRVLGLSYTGLKKLPNLIGELKHLRYLALRETSITCLPESLCKLYNLQVLDLDRCENLCKLPRGMKNLTELRHLKLPILHDSHLCMPRGMGNLTNLQTLSAFYVGGDGYHCGIDELMGMVNLKGELKIYGLNRVLQKTFPDLRTMRSVKKMTLHWNSGSLVKCNYGDTEDDRSQYISATSVLNGLEPPKSIEELVVEAFDGSSLPNWMGNCSYLNLSSIRLDFCNDSCTELPSLGRLPFLKYLSVQGMNALRRIGPEFCGCTPRVAKCFPRLETLEFSEMLSWEEWCNFHENSFPRLSELTIGSCSRLLKLPYGLSPSISTLELQNCESLDSIPMLPTLTSLRLWGNCPFYLWSRSLCLPNLNHLLISFYQLHTLEFFANLPMLRIVRLENCKIEEVIGLQYLKSLEVVELRGCPNLELTQDILQQSNFCVMFAP